jgi:hypothetical protein
MSHVTPDNFAMNDEIYDCHDDVVVVRITTSNEISKY